MKRGIIKCSNWEYKNTDVEFRFISYFYLHSKAEEINGYDCCEGDIKTFSDILSMSVRVVNLLMENGNIFHCLLFSTVEENRMKGLICLCDDLDGIKHAYNYFDKKPSLSLYSHDEDFLLESFPETIKLISQLKRI
jgi:hypothetical protein